jgi:hypothetical protein
METYIYIAKVSDIDNKQKGNKWTVNITLTKAQYFLNNIDILNVITGYVQCCRNVEIVKVQKGFTMGFVLHWLPLWQQVTNLAAHRYFTYGSLSMLDLFCNSLWVSV